MKILRFEAENVKRLKAVQITPAGSLVQITGPNGQGKSSVLDAIYWALAGASAVQGRPVREGEQKAHVRLDLGEIVVTRRFAAAGGTTLTVEAANGARFPSPQAMLDQLLGSLTFDPLAFSRMKPAEQRAELAKLTGLTAQLEALTAENKRDAEERTALNRTVKQLQAQVDAAGEVTPAEPVDVADVLAQIDAAEAANRAREERANRRAEAQLKLEQLWDEAARARREAEAWLQRAESAERDAESLREKLAAAAPLPDPVEVNALRTQLLQAHAANTAAAAWQRHQQLTATLAAERAKVDALTAEIQAREEAKALAVRAAAMPIPGLSLTDEGVTYNGLPFEQASSAEQLRVSVAIAMAANSKLRVLRVKDGSLLDERSLTLLEQLADAGDYQVWVERVDTSGAVGIVMEDGAVVADHLAAEALDACAPADAALAEAVA